MKCCNFCKYSAEYIDCMYCKKFLVEIPHTDTYIEAEECEYYEECVDWGTSEEGKAENERQETQE